MTLTPVQTLPYFGLSVLQLSLIGIAAVCLIALAVVAWQRAHRDHPAFEGYVGKLYQEVKAPIFLLLFLTLIDIASRTFVAPWLNAEFVHAIYSLGFVWIAAWGAIRGVNFAAYLILRRHNALLNNTLDARMVMTQVKILRRLVTALIVILALASALMSFDAVRALGASLLASAGLASVVIGLAAQKTMSNFFTGLQIAVTQPIRLGDNIIVESDYATVEEINLTYVVVKTWDLRRLILPISYFVEKPFQNWSRETVDLLTIVFIWTDFMMPIEPLRAEMTRLLDNTKLWNGKVNNVKVTDANAQAMQLRFMASAANPGDNSDLQQYVREGMITFIQKNYPHFLPQTRSTVVETASANVRPHQTIENAEGRA